MQQRKTVITGGAGFIGSHLAEALVAAGRSLVLIDNLSTGRRSNIGHLLGPSCTFIEADAAEAVRDPAVMRGVDEIYHLAAAVGVRLITDDPTGMIHHNVEQTTVVLNAAIEAGARVLVTSSSEVYGKCPVLPLREDMDLVFGPTTSSRWSYGLSKAISEHLAIDLGRRSGLKSVVVRLFNTIGPRQVGRYGMVAPRFVRWALAGRPLDVYGDGSQTRAFCDVRDVVGALPRLLGNDDCLGRVFNVGSQQTVTIRELAERVIAQTGSEAGYRFVPYEAVYGEGFEDPPHRLPDTTRVREAIGFEPRIPLSQTIDDLIAEARAEQPAAAGEASS